MPATLSQGDIAFQSNLYQSHNPTRNWLHNARRAWVMNKLESYSRPYASFFEVGVGCGVYSAWMGQRGFVTGIDINEDFVLSAGQLRNVTARIGDITQPLDFVNEFDVALCSEVIEHIHDSQTALHNVFQALKNGGLLILTTPNSFSTMELFARLLTFRPISALARWIYGEPVTDLGHINRLTRGQLQKQIEFAGFEVLEQDNISLYLPFVAEFCGMSGTRLSRSMANVLSRSSVLSHLLWTQCWVLRKPTYA